MSKQRKVVGLDIDDVLIDFNSTLAQFHNTHYDTAYVRADIISYDLENLWSCTREEMARRIMEFYGSPEHRNILPIKDAFEVLSRFSKKFTYVNITSRPEVVSGLTREILEGHYPNLMKEAHFLGHLHGGARQHQTKAQICKEVRAKLLIEDSLAHALDVATSGTRVVLLDTPWNQHGTLPDNIERVSGWSEVADIFEAL